MIARDLDKSKAFDLTIIDRREAMVHKIGGLRASVNPFWAENATLVPRDRNTKNAKFIQQGVQAIDAESKTMTLENGDSLNYDVLICATGSQNSSVADPPSDRRSKTDIVEWYRQQHDEIKAATKVAVVGGGLVGVEFAGEIHHEFPDKQIHIFHAGAKLLDTSPLANKHASVQKRLQNALDKKKVKVYLNQRKDREELEQEGFDCVLMATGLSKNTEIYPAAWKDDKGSLKVDEFLQVKGAPGVFAGGDITDVMEEKQFVTSSLHSPVIVKNVNAVVAGKSPSKKYKGAPGPMKGLFVVPIGRDDGVLIQSCIVMGGWVVKKLKGGDLFSSRFFKEAHQPAPKLKGH